MNHLLPLIRFSDNNVQLLKCYPAGCTARTLHSYAHKAIQCVVAIWNADDPDGDDERSARCTWRDLRATGLLPTGHQDNVRYIFFTHWFDFPHARLNAFRAVHIDTNGLERQKKGHLFSERRHFYNSLSNYNFLSLRDCMTLQRKLPSTGAYRTTSTPSAALLCLWQSTAAWDCISLDPHLPTSLSHIFPVTSLQ